MKIKTFGLLATIAFALGLLAPAAYATSAQSSYKKIFGNSSSCAFVAASVNNTTHKAGAQTKNVSGCSSSANSHLAVPAGYLGARVQLNRGSTFCGAAGPIYNTTSSYNIIVTVAKTNASYCPLSGAYNGNAAGSRWSRYDSVYYANTVDSPNLNF